MKVITIGRDESCDIVYDDPNISRRQAVLRLYSGGRIEIIDYSRNGTAVNGVRLAPETLTRITRKDAVSFAGAKTLNWKDVPDPSRTLRTVAVAAIAVIAAVAVGFGGWAIYKAVAGDKPTVNVVETPDHPSASGNPREEKQENVANPDDNGSVNDVIEDAGVFKPQQTQNKPALKADKKESNAHREPNGVNPKGETDKEEVNKTQTAPPTEEPKEEETPTPRRKPI